MNERKDAQPGASANMRAAPLQSVQRRGPCACVRCSHGQLSCGLVLGVQHAAASAGMRMPASSLMLVCAHLL